MSAAFYKPVSQQPPSSEKIQTSSSVDVDTRCGFWIWKPACIQPMAKIGVFTVSLSFASLMTQTLTHYVNSQVTTLERQFGFSSRQTGIIVAANDIGYLACVLFVAHVANRVHIPRSLGIAVIIYGISGISCSLPHFLFGASVNKDPTTDNTNSTESNFSKQSAVVGSLCDIFNISGDPCGIDAAQNVLQQTNLARSERATQVSLVIIFIGMALQGFGKGPRFSFSILYVDDNTSKENTGFYAGTILSAAILGPAVAFLVGGIFSRMYVTLEATQLTPRHPNWIGAWWLGYIVFGLASLVVAVPLFCFPRKLPRKKVKDRHVDEEKMAGNAEPDDLAHFQTAGKQSREYNTATSPTGPITRGTRFKSLIQFGKEFLATLYRLLLNPVYMLLLISSSCFVFASAGNMSFFSKYLERMFHLPVHVANFTTAGVLMCTSCFGTFIGGVLSSRLKMTAMTCLKFTLVMLAICFGCQIVAFIFQCEQPTVHNRPGEENSCNRGCNCRDNSYFPICGDDGRTYYSPCHAGCLQAEHGIYQNCSCVVGGRASSGTCDYSCSHLYGYVVAAGLRNLFLLVSVMPKFIVFLRCVPESDRSMAVSVVSFMAALFGWMLAPIVFGNAIDQACLIWDIKCLTRGRCLLYDNNQFRVTFNGYGTIGVAGSLVFVVTAYLYARWSRCLEDGVQTVMVTEVEETKIVVKDDGTVNT